MRENTIDPIAHTHATPADRRGADGPPPRSWLDKGVARLVALAIAVALAALLVLSLGDDVMALAGYGDVEGEELSPDAQTLEADPRINACIAERVGHVERMAADGLIRPDQVADWTARAGALCRDMPLSAPGAAR